MHLLKILFKSIVKILSKILSINYFKIENKNIILKIVFDISLYTYTKCSIIRLRKTAEVIYSLAVLD